MHQVLRGSRRILPLLIGLAVLAGCAPGVAAPAASKAPPDKVIFLTDFAFFGYTAPFFAGIDQGFFQQENIDLNLQPGNGSPDTSSKVGAGAATIGLVDPFSALIAIQQGAPISFIAAHWQKHVGGICYVQGRRELKTYADFEGIRFAAIADDPYLRILQPLMRADHRNPDTISSETMTIPAASAAMLKGDADGAGCGAATFASRKRSAKADAGIDLGLFLFADHGFDAVGHSLVTHNDLIKSRPELLQRFLNAYAKSVVWAQLNIDKATDAYMKANPQQNREGEKANFEATLPFAGDKVFAGSNGQFYVPPEKMQKTIEGANAWYGLSLSDPEALYTNKFVLALPDALRQGKLP